MGHYYSPTGRNAEGLAASLGELEAIFVDEAGGASHPVVVKGGSGAPAELYVEGIRCMTLRQDSVSQLLTWGVAFSVFCQKLSLKAVQNTATFVGVYILCSDACNKLPKSLAGCLGRLLDGVE